MMILEPKKLELDVLGSTMEAHLLNKRCRRCAISQDSDGKHRLVGDRMLVRDGEGLDADVLLNLLQQLLDENGICNSDAIA